MIEKHWVYKVVVDGSIRYIGYTNDLMRRQKQHNYLIKMGKKKMLYDEVRKLGLKEIKLVTVKTFYNRVDAKRYECLLILLDYFKDKKLWQRIPRIKDL
jgi:predicted GIY-YIG superfamily endonuclease